MNTADIITLPDTPHAEFTDPDAAVAKLESLYRDATQFLIAAFNDLAMGGAPKGRYRAFYPEIRFISTRFDKVDSRLSFGHVAEPGEYATTVTRPDLFRHYLRQQIALLMENHNMPVWIGASQTPIPLHFAMAGRGDVTLPAGGEMALSLRDVFDVPDLGTTNDDIVNGDRVRNADGSFAAGFVHGAALSITRWHGWRITPPPRQSISRTTFYSPTTSSTSMNSKPSPATCCAIPTAATPLSSRRGTPLSPTRMERSLPCPACRKMPTYHLKRAMGAGITLVNIGVGPSNAKTATDHIAVLRPHAWLMVGHCAGLRNSQALGDFVLAHAYLREDNVLDADLPVWVPIPALAEIQIALQDAVAQVTKLDGYGLKQIMRTGTVATIDNRNWELRDQSGPVQRLSQSRAIALDMESATIAANGFRFRVPYGTLLCVSDKPLHGELKLPGMASSFYKTQVARHLQIGIRAMELLRDMPLERIHSRKLRSFSETAFL